MFEFTIEELVKGGIIATLTGMTIIQITPIKINPWSFILRSIGRAINGELIEKVDKLEKEVQSLRSEADERAAKDGRVRILRFGDEILHKKKHSKEHFDQILQDITEYENYCEAHKDFKNNMTVMTSANIKDAYEKCLKDGDFL